MDKVEDQLIEAPDPELLRRRRERVLLILGGLLVFAFAGVVAYWLKESNTDRDMMPVAAQAAIARQLRVHGALHFNSPSEAQVVPLSDGQFLVRGWVTDIAADGRSWRYLYSVTVIAGPTEYAFSDITVTEQF